MFNKDAVRWFKANFQDEIQKAIKGTPFSVDLITAIAMQETGYIWSKLYTQMPVDEVLALCVGDTLDQKVVNGVNKGRSAFPKSRAELEQYPNGKLMFSIARRALEKMAAKVPGYASAVANKNKFCHGFGIFQYDLQHFRADPEYFLSYGWESFPKALGKCIAELKAAQKRIPSLRGETNLSDTERIAVAIAYNRGSYDPSRGLKQGHFDGYRYYGEYIAEYIRISKEVQVNSLEEARKPRLILAKTEPDGWKYQAMTSAELEDGVFEVERIEVGKFLGRELLAGRAAIRDLLQRIKVPFVVSTEHLKDAKNPRVYVFVEA